MRFLFVIIALLDVFLILLPLAKAIVHGIQCRKWPTTFGQIKSAQVTLQKGGKGWQYIVVVHYSYAVEAMQYVSNRESFAIKSYLRKASAQHAVEHYLANKRITVHYHPNKPQLAVIDTRWPVINLALFILSLSVFLFCLMVIMNG